MNIFQSREGNLEDFFQHENMSYSPSLSTGGQLRQGTRADLLTCLYSHGEPVTEPPDFDAKVIDGPVLVHMLTPGKFDYDISIENLASDYEDAFIDSCIYISMHMVVPRLKTQIWDKHKFISDNWHMSWSDFWKQSSQISSIFTRCCEDFPSICEWCLPALHLRPAEESDSYRCHMGQVSACCVHDYSPSNNFMN